MKDFEGRVAVVTGAASGIGRALAEQFAEQGMKVVLADVEEPALASAVQALRRREFEVSGVVCDVSDGQSVQDLARQTLDTYGKVHIVCNNAGVVTEGDLGGLGTSGPAQRLWELPLKDWQWTFGVNLWGVVHGIRTFVPLMLAQDEEGHIVNTASMAGLTTGRGLPIYSTSKHAVVRLTEGLQLQLKAMDAKVAASVLCPAGVRTRIATAIRNRPGEASDAGAPDEEELRRRDGQWALRTGPTGMDPAEVAAKVIQAIRDEVFYILPHDNDAGVRARLEGITDRRQPVVGTLG